MRIQRLFILIVLCSLFYSPRAGAGVFEFSFGFFFNRSQYSDGDESFKWTRRWVGEVAYHFTQYSGVEFAYVDSTERTKIKSFQDITTHDQIFSLTWVQSLLEREALVQPFFKVGAGQLNRTASGQYQDGSTPAQEVGSLTGVLAAGARINFSERFGGKLEFTSYLDAFRIATWHDNIAASVGLSLFY